MSDGGKDAEIERLREALKAAQKVLQALISPGNPHLSSTHLWMQAVAAETLARKALTDDVGN